MGEAHGEGMGPGMNTKLVRVYMVVEVSVEWDEDTILLWTTKPDRTEPDRPYCPAEVHAVHAVYVREGYDGTFSAVTGCSREDLDPIGSLVEEKSK